MPCGRGGTSPWRCRSVEVQSLRDKMGSHLVPCFPKNCQRIPFYRIPIFAFFPCSRFRFPFRLMLRIFCSNPPHLTTFEAFGDQTFPIEFPFSWQNACFLFWSRFPFYRIPILSRRDCSGRRPGIVHFRKHNVFKGKNGFITT